MSIFAVDFTNSFSESFLTEVKNTIKSSKKTEVDLDPKLNVKSADVDDNDEDDQFLDADDKVGKRPKKNKKSSVSEKYNVSFSDKEIAHFEKIINKEGIKN
jgi:hypothetical protein